MWLPERVAGRNQKHKRRNSRGSRIFKEGDTVICEDPGSLRFTEGRAYTVLGYDPEGLVGNPYVTLNDDTGKTISAYADRFRLKVNKE